MPLINGIFTTRTPGPELGGQSDKVGCVWSLGLRGRTRADVFTRSLHSHIPHPASSVCQGNFVRPHGGGYVTYTQSHCGSSEILFYEIKWWIGVFYSCPLRTYAKMIVPFCDIPSQFLTPLNVETKVHYTLDMKKFPGLSSDAAPALMIAPSKLTTDLVECGRECCYDPASLPTTRPQCDYALTPQDLTSAATLIDAQRELFQLLGN